MIPFDDPSQQGPIDVFRDWLSQAEQTEPNDPNAVALATATAEGVPSVRMVLLKGVDDRGLRFFTNGDSQKGKELLGNPEAAMCFHWKSLRRQVRFAGGVKPLDRADVDAYFHSRGRGSQIAAAVSLQSRPLASREELDSKAKAFAEALGDSPVPLPDGWAGFLLEPRVVEFWSDGEHRLHNRMQYTRDGASWKAQRLYP